MPGHSDLEGKRPSLWSLPEVPLSASPPAVLCSPSLTLHVVLPLAFPQTVSCLVCFSDNFCLPQRLAGPAQPTLTFPNPDIPFCSVSRSSAHRGPNITHTPRPDTQAWLDRGIARLTIQLRCSAPTPSAALRLPPVCWGDGLRTPPETQ